MWLRSCSKTEWGVQQDAWGCGPSTGASQHYDNSGQGWRPGGREPAPGCRRLRPRQCCSPWFHDTCPLRPPLQLAGLSKRKLSLPRRFPSLVSRKWVWRWQHLDRTLVLGPCLALPRAGNLVTWGPAQDRVWPVSGPSEPPKTQTSGQLFVGFVFLWPAAASKYMCRMLKTLVISSGKSPNALSARTPASFSCPPPSGNYSLSWPAFHSNLLSFLPGKWGFNKANYETPLLESDKKEDL